MRALILSDIHGNLEALEAVLAAAPVCDAVWNLGDVVGYGANPNEVIDLVRGMAAINVRGNHDRVCCGLTPLEDFNPIAAEAARWTQTVLTPNNLQWLRDLAPGPLMPNGPEVSCSHGSLLDEDEYIVTKRDAYLPLNEATTRINFFGHTHVQGGFARHGEDWFLLHPEFFTNTDAEEYFLELRSSACYLLNPGSVGQPRDMDWRAAFAVYDEQRAGVTFYRIPYDLAEAQARILQAGLPVRLAARLSEGR
jgi:predicted phosphodiesterase